jgi:hypothetical protein
MAVVALKCPNCGAMIPRESLTCEYCGANVILTPDKTALNAQSTFSCPKCSSQVSNSAWFCPKCLTVLTKDTQHLKEIQRKFQFVQQDLRTKYSQACSVLEPSEFIYFIFHQKELLINRCYIITEKKLLFYDMRKNQDKPMLLSEIVSVGKPYFKGGGAVFRHFIQVQTFKETITLDFGVDHMASRNAWTFHNVLSKALGDYTAQRRDIRGIIGSLKIP